MRESRITFLLAWLGLPRPRMVPEEEKVMNLRCVKSVFFENSIGPAKAIP
jgi:hypothetical protein